ncbi:MAG: hypothetical protein JKY52_11045 [Flavobacteriales bacterium]|nr:hypothetical protein [Flavobacteriales bacterium]
MKKVLVIGGTLFIGRCLVEKLVKDPNLQITLFNRGLTNPGLFPEVQTIIGDRETGDIDRVADQDWDFIFDISCYYPNRFKDLIPKLKGSVGRYILVSTVSAYVLEDAPAQLITEDNDLIGCTAEEAVDTSMRTYGKRKAECDRILLEAEWLDKIIIRPSIVYGKYDSTWRFYHWLYRINLDATMILPNGGVDRANYAYVEDLANILVESMTLEQHSITYNVSTHPVLAFKELLKKTVAVMERNPKFVSVNVQALEQQKIYPVKDVPLWLNGSFLLIDNGKLRRDFSVEFVDFDLSLKQTVAYYESLKWPEPQVGMDLNDEKELLLRLT